MTILMRFIQKREIVFSLRFLNVTDVQGSFQLLLRHPFSVQRLATRRSIAHFFIGLCAFFVSVFFMRVLNKQ